MELVIATLYLGVGAALTAIVRPYFVISPNDLGRIFLVWIAWPFAFIYALTHKLWID